MINQWMAWGTLFSDKPGRPSLSDISVGETMSLQGLSSLRVWGVQQMLGDLQKLLWHHIFQAGMETLWNDHKFITQICFMLCFPLNPSFLTTRIPSHPQSRLLPTPHKDGKWPWFANGLEQLCNHHFLMLHHPISPYLGWLNHVKPPCSSMFHHFGCLNDMKSHEIPWNPMKSYEIPQAPASRSKSALRGSAPAPRAGRWHRLAPAPASPGLPPPPHRTERLEMMGGSPNPKRGELPVQTIRSWWFYQQK